MKTTQELSPVSRGGTKSETAFSIKGTAKAFDILSSGLYSNKILAIVRELSCNAYDAHVAAGKKDVPIEIRLPSSLDPTFYVRDYGIGLDHAGICGLYTTYFESTKNDSNDFIGALGLGSKSPFSYTSAFVVESRFDGVKRTYSAFKNEEGMPSITLLGEEKTTDCNGIQVSMAVKRDDIDKFHDAAKKALMYFTPQPKILGRNGFAPYKVKHIVSGSIWKVREAEYYSNMRGPYVVQGFVAYPVNGEILREHGVSKEALSMLNTDIDIYVPIGKVEVAASREALSYTKATIKNLAESLEIVAKEIRASFQTEIDKCATLWEARMKHLQFQHADHLAHVYRELSEKQEFVWKKTQLDESFKIDVTKVKHTQFGHSSLSSRGHKLSTSGQWEPTSLVKDYHVHLHAGTCVILDPDLKGNSDIIRQYLDAQPNKRNAYAYVLRPTVKNGINQTEIDAIVQALGNPTLLKVADLGFAKVKSTARYVKKDKAIKLVWDGFKDKSSSYRGHTSLNRTFSNKTWAREAIDINDGGIYVPVERFSVLKNGSEFLNIDELVAHATSLGLLVKGTKIFGFNEKERIEIAKIKGWVSLFDYVVANFDTANATGRFTNRLTYDAFAGETAGGGALRVISDWSFVGSKIGKGQFKQKTETVIALTSQLRTSVDPRATESFLDLIDKVDVRNAAKQKGIDMANEWGNMLHEYPMLTLFSWGNIGSKSIGLVVDYINQVDNSKNLTVHSK